LIISDAGVIIIAGNVEYLRRQGIHCWSCPVQMPK